MQRDANRLLGFTAQQTLDYLQNLYEKKLCTYPRTDSRYLTSDMAEGLPLLVNVAAKAMPFAKGSAVLELVSLRLLCAVGQPYEYAETVVQLDCAGHSFTARGRAVQNPGWKQLEESYRAGLKDAQEPAADNDAKALPVITGGQVFPVTVPGIKEGKTTPPKHFTDVLCCQCGAWKAPRKKGAG